MDLQRLAHDAENRHARIERAERVLEDHLDLPAQRAELPLAHRQNFASVEKNLPAVAAASFRIVRPMVVLPLPLSPTSPTVEPASTVKLTSSTAFTSSMCRRRMPAVDGKLGLEVFDFQELAAIYDSLELGVIESRVSADWFGAPGA